MQPNGPQPHYLLFAAASWQSCQLGRWRFVLEPIDAGQRIVAADVEPEIDRSRLELLAVVRGLEALEQPSQVTLLTRSRYVRRGLRHDLCQWRDASWRWERFGKLVPIRDLDLWQRVDLAQSFHEISCLRWQWDEVAHELQERSESLSSPARSVECPVASGEIAATGPRVVLPRRRSRRRGRIGRGPSGPARLGVGNWGQSVLAAVTALGRPALSRSA